LDIDQATLPHFSSRKKQLTPIKCCWARSYTFCKSTRKGLLHRFLLPLKGSKRFSLLNCWNCLILVTKNLKEVIYWVAITLYKTIFH
jgi:hypothetical protein